MKTGTILRFIFLAVVQIGLLIAILIRLFSIDGMMKVQTCHMLNDNEESFQNCLNDE